MARAAFINPLTLAPSSVPGQPPEGVEQGAQLSDFVKFPDTWPFFL